MRHVREEQSSHIGDETTQETRPEMVEQLDRSAQWEAGWKTDSCLDLEAPNSKLLAIQRLLADWLDPLLCASPGQERCLISDSQWGPVNASPRKQSFSLEWK